MLCWYYLHSNGDLIVKYHEAPELGGFVQHVWRIDTSDRRCAWDLCTEALAMGANRARICELADKWRLTDEDARIYAERTGLDIHREGDEWSAVYKDQTRRPGRGPSVLEAIADMRRHDAD